MDNCNITAPDPGKLALLGVRVLEIGSGYALAYTGKLFADFGAQVIKVEPPQGDALRRMPPWAQTGASAAESGLFAWLNTHKHSVRDRQDAAWLADLARHCDVVLDARALDEGLEVLAKPVWGEPSADGHVPIEVAFTWFGADGPYSHFKGSDAVCRALSGALHGSGPVQGPPHLPHDLQTGIAAGLSAFSVAVAAWIGRAHGSRRFVQSIHEAALATVEMEAGMVQDGRHPRRRLGVNRFCNTHPAGIYETAQGWIGLFTHTGPQWAALCQAIGRPELADDPRYTTGADRIARADEVDALIAPAMRKRTAQAWFDDLRAKKHPTVLVPTMAELLQQEVHRQRAAFVPVTLGDARFEAPVVPMRLDEAGPLLGGEAPALGAHDALYRSPEAVRQDTVMRPAPADALPMAGVRVLDLTMGWAGPQATRTLADLGADVIKVESTGYPDWWRGANFTEAFYSERQYEKNNNFNLMNRNKRGITLDLTCAEGRELLLSLAQQCDVVIENYSAEVLPKLGLDYSALRAVNPKLVMLSMPAFGLGNAWSDTRAYGGTLEQASGLPLYTGHPEHPPAMTSYAYGDPIGGLHAGAALLIGLLVQRNTGEGRQINLSQVEGMLTLTAPWLIEQSITGHVGPRLGNRHPMYAPHGCYPCAGDDAWVVVSVQSDSEWQALCRVLDQPLLATDSGLLDVAGRRARQAELDALISSWTRQRLADAAMFELQTAGVAAGVVRPMWQVLEDPHLQARGFWRSLDRAHVGQYISSTTSYRQSGQPMPILRPAPTLGEHTAEVLSTLLQLGATQIAALEQQGVIGTTARRKSAKTEA